MTRFDITFDSDGLGQIISSLALRLSPAGLAGYLATTVDPFLRTRIDSRFDQEGDDVSGAWHPLEHATQMIRASYGFAPSHPINIRTDKLRSFLTGTVGDVRPTGIGATLSHPPPTSDPWLTKKIATAQGGSPSPKTPARPVIGVNQNDLMFVTTSLVAWISQDFI